MSGDYNKGKFLVSKQQTLLRVLWWTFISCNWKWSYRQIINGFKITIYYLNVFLRWKFESLIVHSKTFSQSFVLNELTSKEQCTSVSSKVKCPLILITNNSSSPQSFSTKLHKGIPFLSLWYSNLSKPSIWLSYWNRSRKWNW